MAGTKTINNIDRKKELEKLLENLRKVDTQNDSNIDLILKYLEKLLSKPDISGGSKKLLEFNIRDDINTLSKIYNISWRKTRLEEEHEKINKTG